MDRVFLDANILFSAAYRPDAGLRRLWELSDIELVTSAYAVEEARRNLDHPKQHADLEKLLRAVRVTETTPRDRPLGPTVNPVPRLDSRGIGDNPSGLPRRSSPPSQAGLPPWYRAQLPDADRPILLAAIEVRATHLLTGDARHFGRYYGRVVEGVRILPPGVYLRTRRKRGRVRER